METQSAEAETYRGVVRRVFFCNPSKPWMSGVLQPEGSAGEIKFSGKVAAQVGDRLEITGSWTQHPKYGRQFEAETGLVKMDESPDALIHLLASDGRFKQLGPVRARKVVEAALALSEDGDIASALKKYGAAIADRSGVSLDIVENAAEVWNAKRGYFDALALLCGQGWSNAQAQTIVSVLGENAPSIVRADPYMLIGRIPRFGFRTVDVIAIKMGTKSTDPARLSAGLAYVLDEMGGEGNTFTTRDGLIAQAIQEMRPDTLDGEDLIRDQLELLINLGHIHLDVLPSGEEVVADARLAAVEFDVFERLLAGLGDADVKPLSMNGPRAQAILPTLNQGQAAALAGFSKFRFGVISGGAGVGKTYTMRAICEVAEENGLVVALCAPTGKAARKLAHATGRSAATIHRLLEPTFDEATGAFSFGRGAKYPLEADLIIVDEVSMMDVRLARSLLTALNPTGLPPERGPAARLLLVGDHNQIPSVSPGAILRDVLSARKRYPGSVHILTEIVRQAGVLARNTTAILDGMVVTQGSPPWGIEQTEKGHEESAAAMVSSLVESVVTSPEPLQPFNRPLDLAWDVQVLAPMRKGPLGTYALNVHLQRLRQRLLGNPPPEPVEKDDRSKPLIGDRVIWTKNDYTLDLFNGTQAIVTGLKKGGAMDLFVEDGREVTIPPEKKGHVELAYALTIHKSQGSEWPFVVLVASSSHWHMHDRNLLYTGASRASESLTILGDLTGVRHFAKERRSFHRQTFGEHLVAGWKPKLDAKAQHPLRLVDGPPEGSDG